MEKTDQSDFQKETSTSPPGPWPWYVLIPAGLALTGLFPWLMVGWAFYHRGEKRTAALISVTHLTLFMLLGWACLHIRLPWWWLSPIIYSINLLWAVAAWLIQNNKLGQAKKRYSIRDYKSWIIPVLIGIFIGVSIGTLFSVSPALENRMAMRQSIDSLDRETVLWTFFQYSFFGGFWGLLLGIWWAGEGKEFNARHVIIFVCALALTIVTWLLVWHFLQFLIRGGIVIDRADFKYSKWALIPPWMSGLRGQLLQFQSHDISALLIVPLLFGSVSRIRDFWKRSLVIILALFCLLPISFTTLDWWRDNQSKIFYDMSAPDQGKRDSAHKWASIMLARYPDHLQWPKIAQDLARYYYESGHYQKSKAYYQAITDRYQNSNQWYWVVNRARAALNSPEFGKSAAKHTIAIPLVDYEEYLTRNWMSLLSVIRYWKGPAVAESQVIIELKHISHSDDKIELTPMENLADLDDAARNLGYDVTILPANLANAKDLIAAGTPVILPCYNRFYLIFGFDDSRSVIRAYSFGKLSYTLKKEARREAKEILSMEEEGRGKSKNRLARIANQAYTEITYGYWASDALRAISPLMAIVHPSEKNNAIAQAVHSAPDILARESGGYLAALIGLSHLDFADPVMAVEWGKISTDKIPDPMPLYVVHLARMLWEHRKAKIKSNIPLQDQFNELAEIFAYFEKPDNRAVINAARDRFETDLAANRLPWMFSRKYFSMLDRSDSNDLEQIIHIYKSKITINPSDFNSWRYLAQMYEWAEDLTGQVEALAGAISCNPLHTDSKLKLAYGYVLLGQFSAAEAILKDIDSNKIRFDADYPFCLGAIAEWQGNVNKALENYKTAIEMRRYKPVYHLSYGRLLLKQGRHAEARKVLAWAALIDAGDSVKNEAQKLLSKIE